MRQQVIEKVFDEDSDEEIDWDDFYYRNELWIDEWVKKNNGDLHVIFKIDDTNDQVELYSKWKIISSNITREDLQNDDNPTTTHEHNQRCDEIKSTLDNFFIPYYDTCLSKLVCDYVSMEPVTVLLHVDVDHDQWCPDNILVSLKFPKEIPTMYFDYELITREQLLHGIMEKDHENIGVFHFVRLLEMEYETLYHLNDYCSIFRYDNWKLQSDEFYKEREQCRKNKK